MKLQRRDVLKGMLGGASAAALGAPAVHAQAAAAKIGLLTVKTGPLAQGGFQMEQGIASFLREKNNTLAGRKVELITADTGGAPAGTLNKARELIERDGVDVILGPLAAFELLAITAYVRDKTTPVITLAAAEDVTQRAANPWVVRPSSSSGQTPHVMADYAAKELKLKTMATMANDFAFGHEQCAAFQRVFEEQGGKVVKKLWPPLNTSDYLPYISQLTDIDGWFNGFGGGIPVRVGRSLADLGLAKKIVTTGGSTNMDDALLKSMGDEAVGVYSAAWYTPDFKSASNERFVADMQKTYSEVPGSYAAAMYTGGQVIEAVMQKTGGKTDNKEAFRDAMHAVSLPDTPRGPLRFDKYGQAVGPVFIRKCERRDGKLVNVTLKTYPDVSQFWTYDEAAFLAQPVYSRDYPPAKNLRP